MQQLRRGSNKAIDRLDVKEPAHFEVTESPASLTEARGFRRLI